MIVCKFGGTSVQDAPAILRLVAIVRDRLAHQPVVVVSALARVTDQLVRLADGSRGGETGLLDTTLDALLERHQQVALALPGGDAAVEPIADDVAALRDLLHHAAGRALTPAERDDVTGRGELWSSRLVVAALAGAGLPAAWVDARSVVVTDDRFGRATPLPDRIAERAAIELAPLAQAGHVAVTQGFVGATAAGVTTTLGRGGSDLTASLVGAALGASRVEIWTDVDGLMTADPRLVPAARTLAQASYEEAAELATFGAKVLHPATQLPLAEAGIPIVILNSMQPARPGTVIGAVADAGTPQGPVRSISWKRGITVINVRAPRMLGAFGFLRQLFAVFERHEVVVDVLASSEVNVSLTIEEAHRLPAMLHELEGLGDVTVAGERAIVAVVGGGIRHQAGLAARIFAAASPANVELVSMGSNAINLTFVVHQDDGPGVVRRLHHAFFEAA